MLGEFGENGEPYTVEVFIFNAVLFDEIEEGFNDDLRGVTCVPVDDDGIETGEDIRETSADLGLPDLDTEPLMFSIEIDGD